MATDLYFATIAQVNNEAPGEEVTKVVGDYIYAKEFKCKYCSSSLVDLIFSTASRVARRSLNAMVSTNNTFCQFRIYVTSQKPRLLVTALWRICDHGVDRPLLIRVTCYHNNTV